MLSSPVYIESHPRRNAAFASRMNLRDAANAASSSSLKSFNSFLPRTNGRGTFSLTSHFRADVSLNSFVIRRFRTLPCPERSRGVRNGRPQPFSFQSLPDSFHCNGGVYPLSNGIPSTGRAGQAPPLQGAEEFVEFVGGVEVGFEFAGGEALAKIVEAAGEKIECGGKDVAVGEDDVAPGGIGAAGKAE
jgi:hypothetical protein